MSETLIFVNAFLIDGTGAEPREGATVVVAGGLIQEVGGSGLKAPGGRLVDLRGKTLLPGLIDAHVHIGNIEIRNHLTAQLPPAVYVLRACRNLETDLAWASPRSGMRPVWTPASARPSSRGWSAVPGCC